MSGEPTGTWRYDGRYLYVDTAMLNDRARHGLSLRHLGFGDFAADTPEGQVTFSRGDGCGLENTLEWGNCSGRPHLVRGPGSDWLLAKLTEGE